MPEIGTSSEKSAIHTTPLKKRHGWAAFYVSAL